MYRQEEEIQEARYQRWRAERWVRTYVEELPEILWAGDFRSGRLARLAERRELLRVSAYGYVEPPPREWPRWRRRRYVDRARARAVALSIPETCAVGGPHAALLHGLPVLYVPPVVEVHGESFPSTVRPRRDYRRVVREGVTRDVDVVEGMRVTNLDRTVIECARRLPLDGALVVADAALNKSVWPDPKQRSEGDRAAAAARVRWQKLLAGEPGRRGNKRARLVLEMVDGWAESPLESRMRRALLAIGLPAPRLQTEILTRRHRYFVDAALTWKRADGSVWVTVFEADGRGKQVRAANVIRDREREAEIRMTGAEYLSLNDDHLSQPGFGELTEQVMAVVPPEARAAMRSVPRYLTNRERRDGLAIDWWPVDHPRWATAR